MNCRGIRGRSKTTGKSVRFSSDYMSAGPSKPHKDYNTNSSNDRKQSTDRRSTGSGREEVNTVKCRFYKSAGDESSVERREFEIWNGSLRGHFAAKFFYVRSPDNLRGEMPVWTDQRGSITFTDFLATLKRKFKLIEPIFEHYKLFAVIPNGQRWTVSEEDEFIRIYEGIGLLFRNGLIQFYNCKQTQQIVAL